MVKRITSKNTSSPVAWLAMWLLLTACHGSPASPRQEAQQTTTLAMHAAGCVDPDLKKIFRETSFTRCDGTVVSGERDRPSHCTADGESDCLVDGVNFRAVALAEAQPGHIKAGVTIAGVAGAYPSATHPLSESDGSVAHLGASTFETAVKESAAFEWYDASGLRHTFTGSPSLKPGLILKDVKIFGTTGTYDHAMTVMNLKSVRGYNRVLLSWTRSGGTGVLIVRGVSSIGWQPTHGMSYSVGFTSGDVKVIYNGSDAAVPDPARNERHGVLL